MKSLTDWWSDLADLMSQSLRRPTMGPRRHRTQRAPHPGWFVPMGGDTLDDDVVVSLIHLANGRRQPTVVVPIAVDAQTLGAALVASLHRFGIADVSLQSITADGGDVDPPAVQQIATARLIIIGGHDAGFIMAALADSPYWQAINRAFGRGAIVAATGAAATVLGAVIPPSADGVAVSLLPRNGINGADTGLPNASLGVGLKLTDRLAIDADIAEGNGLGRLLFVAAHQPDLLALGLADGTAAFIGPGDDLRVVGKGVGIIVDGRQVRGNTGRGKQDAPPNAWCDLRVHVLPAGHGFDLVSRRPLTPKALTDTTHRPVPRIRRAP